MSVWGYLKQFVFPAESHTPTPVPPTPDDVVQRRQAALKRYAADCVRYKAFVTKAQATGFLPPHPPSPNWYESHPEYTWNPHGPNPERPDKPAPPRPEPKPNPQPTPDQVNNRLDAQKRWKTDWDRYRGLSQDRGNKPKSQPPSIDYYVAHSQYTWNPQEDQVR